MKPMILLCAALLLADLMEATAEQRAKPMGEGATKPDTPLRVTLELRDGSRLVGIPSIESLPVKASFARLDVPLKLVETIEFEADRETARIRCGNGDQFRGVINLSAITLNTCFGKVSVLLKDIARLTAEAGSVTRGRVLYYSFDKDDEANASDLSGHGNPGTLHGTRWTSRGKEGGARVFNGESDYISRDHDERSGLFPTDAAISVVAWFKTASATPKHQTIAATHFAGMGRDGYFLSVDMRDHGGRAFWFTGSNEQFVTSTSAVNDGQWHFAVGIWDAGKSSLYIDGVLQGKATTPSPLVFEHRASFQIGHQENNGAPHARDAFYYFTGTIDEVMIFDRALSESEVKTLFAAQK